MYVRAGMVCLRTIALTCLALLYAVVSVGILPSPAMIVRWCGRLTFERFPCEDCACGCATAHECWTACCCHSTTERLAWAISEGVTPPESVVFTDAEWIAAANSLRPGSARCVLCVAAIKDQVGRGIVTRVDHTKASCCGGDRLGADRCQLPDASCCASEQDSADTATGGRVDRAFPCVSALSCKRQMPLMTLPPMPTTPRDQVPAVDALWAQRPPFDRPAGERFVSRSLDQREPPPRHAA